MSSREQTRESRARFVAMACALLATGWIFASLEGCEILVGSTVSDLPCVDAPGACPSGQACIRGTCTACSGSSCQADASTDVTVRDSGPPPVDAPAGDIGTRDRQAGSDVNQPDVQDASKLLGLGATCTLGSMCASGLCGDATLLVGLSVGTGICTQPCCTSGDCGLASGGAVCYPSVGGNYCVGASELSRSTLGGSVAGGECGSGADCRSGACDTSSSICEDTCCVDTDCASSVCQSSSYGSSQSQNYNCGPSSGGGGQGAECLIASACQSELCVGDPAGGTEDTDADGFCYAPCCSESDCPNTDNLGDPTSCTWSQVGPMGGPNSWTRSCTDAVSNGTKTFGQECTGNTDCASGLCNAKVCTIPCCGTGAGIGSVCGSQTCGYATFTFSGKTVDLQVCVAE